MRSVWHRRSAAPTWPAALWLLLAAPAVVAADAASCPADRIDARAEVVQVIDGDTVRLADRRLLRLIGIDTPELGRDGRPDEPLAAQARERLAALLRAQGNRIGLRYDATRRDDYGRTLAHIYTADGQSLTAWLAAAGLGSLLLVPPNDWNYGCHLAAETLARDVRRGLWGLPAYRIRDAASLDLGDTGYRWVEGKVVGLGRGRDFWYLDLAGPVSLAIARRQAQTFAPGFDERLIGRRLRARGMLRPHPDPDHRGRLRMTLAHPAALEWLTP